VQTRAALTRKDVVLPGRVIAEISMRLTNLVIALSLGFAGAAVAGEKAPTLIKPGIELAFEITDSYIEAKPEGGGLVTIAVCNLSQTTGQLVVSDIAPIDSSKDGLPPSLGVYSVPPRKCLTGLKGYDVSIGGKEPWSGTLRFD